MRLKQFVQPNTRRLLVIKIEFGNEWVEMSRDNQMYYRGEISTDEYFNKLMALGMEHPNDKITIIETNYQGGDDADN